MSNWPKDYIIVKKNRPGTFAARMEEKAIEWRLNSSKRYTRDGAQRAFQTLHKRHRGMEWGVFYCPTESLVLYTEKLPKVGEPSASTVG